MLGGGVPASPAGLLQPTAAGQPPVAVALHGLHAGRRAPHRLMEGAASPHVPQLVP